MIAPVEGSGDWPAWITRVANSCCFFMSSADYAELRREEGIESGTHETRRQFSKLRGRSKIRQTSRDGRQACFGRQASCLLLLEPPGWKPVSRDRQRYLSAASVACGTLFTSIRARPARSILACAAVNMREGRCA